MSGASLDRSHLEAVARLFEVLAEPTRLEILQHLQQRPFAVKELVEAMAAKQANVSKQLGILHDAGLVRRDRDGNLVRYSVSEPMIFELCQLVCGKLQRDAERQLDGLRRLTGMQPPTEPFVPGDRPQGRNRSSGKRR